MPLYFSYPHGQQDLPFFHRDGFLLVDLRRGAANGETLKLTFEVEGDLLGRVLSYDFWRLTPGEGWFPEPDMAGQSYTVKARIAVEKPFLAIASAKTVSRSANATHNLLEVSMDKPILWFSVAAGKYESSEMVKNGRTVRAWSYGGVGKGADQLLKTAHGVLEFYSQLLGSAPFEEVNLVEVPSLGFGQAPAGMIWLTREAFDAVGDDVSRMVAAFELREEVHTFQVATPQRGRGKATTDSYTAPTYRREATGVLTLRILEPTVYGIRDRWQDMKRLRIEDRLEAFMLSAVAIAEYKRQVAVERERQAQKEKEAREKAALVAAERRRIAQRLYDLDGRLQDCQMAEQIRAFLAKAKARQPEGADGPGATPELAEWMTWAESLADELESEALGTLQHLRKPPEPTTSSIQIRDSDDVEVRLHHQVDLWQRRYIYGRR